LLLDLTQRSLEQIGAPPPPAVPGWVAQVHDERVEAGAVVAVAALVHAGTVLPSGPFLAPGMIAIGDPVATYAPGDPVLPEAIKGVGFAGRAFGVRTEWEDRIARYRETAEVRSEEFSAHADDEVVAP